MLPFARSSAPPGSHFTLPVGSTGGTDPGGANDAGTGTGSVATTPVLPHALPISQELALYLLNDMGAVRCAMGMGPFHPHQHPDVVHGRYLHDLIGGDLEAPIRRAFADGLGAGVASCPPEGRCHSGMSRLGTPVVVELFATRCPHSGRDLLLATVCDLSAMTALHTAWATARPYADIGQATIRASGALNNVHHAIANLLGLLQMPGIDRARLAGHLEVLREATDDAASLVLGLTASGVDAPVARDVYDCEYLDDVVEDVVAEHGLAISPGGLRVVWREATELRQMVRAVPADLREALRHVVEEAAVAAFDLIAPRAGVRPEGITLDMHVSHTATHIAVVMIPSRTLGPTARAIDPAAVTHTPGFLAAQALLRRMGGDLALDEASALCIRLSVALADPVRAHDRSLALRGVVPRATPRVLEARVTDDALPGPGPGPADGAMDAACALSGQRILIVDDDKHFRYSTRELFRMYGARVFEACNGHDALAMLREDPGAFDLVLLDRRMPDMRGEEVFRTLQRERPEVIARVVFMSGDRLALHRDFADFLLEARVVCIEKPVTPQDLVAYLGGHLQRLQRLAQHAVPAGAIQNGRPALPAPVE